MGNFDFFTMVEVVFKRGICNEERKKGMDKWTHSLLRLFFTIQVCGNAMDDDGNQNLRKTDNDDDVHT